MLQAGWPWEQIPGSAIAGRLGCEHLVQVETGRLGLSTELAIAESPDEVAGEDAGLEDNAGSLKGQRAGQRSVPASAACRPAPQHEDSHEDVHDSAEDVKGALRSCGR